MEQKRSRCKAAALLLMGLLLWGAGPAWSAPSGTERERGTVEKAPDRDRVSYSLGADMAKNFRRLGIEVNADLLGKGLKDGLSGEKPLMSESEINETLHAFQAWLKTIQPKVLKELAEKNEKKSEAFLAANGTREGVVSMPSGLQYRILKAGNGRTPTDKDTVECHYRGSLPDGTEFESSYWNGKPVVFKVSGALPGWQEALKLMPEGSKWELLVPSKLAYGERGGGRNIEPGALLIFELELLAVK